MNLLLFTSILIFLKATHGYETVCYGELGCFTNAPPFGDTDQRPFTQLPSHPDDVNVRFYLDTRIEKEREVFNENMGDLASTSFDGAKPTKFIVHGFLHNGEALWMNDMSEALLTIGDFNVIRAGWLGSSLTINYPQAATDTQVVGAEIGLFIKNIMTNFGSSSTSFHCIGHSLGAQTCGYVGAFVSPKIGRISGLDAAGPYFEGTPTEVRLDPSDADFVDAMHTDAEKLIDLGFGTNQISGHVDFWPNNGLNQPGCDQNALSTIVGVDGVVLGVQDFFACNHLRAVYFYTETITSSCPFSSTACSSYDDYRSGKCLSCPNGVCTSMGYHSIDTKDAIYQSSTPNYFLQTGAFSAYCRYAMYVQVTLGNVGDSIRGKLYLSLYSPSSNTENHQLSNREDELSLRPSSTYSYLAQYQSLPTNLNRAKLLWTQEEWTIGTKYISVAEINVWVESEQKQYKFCGDPGAKLKENERYSFYTC